MNAHARQSTLGECDAARHDAAVQNLAERDISLRAFRVAADDLLCRLEALGENKQNTEAEQKRQDLMNTLKGALEDSRCPQTMIASF